MRILGGDYGKVYTFWWFTHKRWSYLFFSELPKNLIWKKPVLQEINDEIYAVIGENIYIPVERLPLDTLINSGKGLITLAVINEENFLAKIVYVIEIQKETALELYTLIKAKALIKD